jgi:hypothetical protein
VTRIVQIRTAECAPFVAQQQVQQAEFGARQIDRLTMQAGDVSRRIDEQRTKGQWAGSLGAICREHLLQPFVAAQQGPHSRDKLARAKWFGQIIVRADLQANDAIHLLRSRGQHQHG